MKPIIVKPVEKVKILLVDRNGNALIVERSKPIGFRFGEKK